MTIPLFSRLDRRLFDAPYLLLVLTMLFWSGNLVGRPLRGRARAAAGGVTTESVAGGFLVRDPWSTAMRVLAAGAGGRQA